MTSIKLMKVLVIITVYFCIYSCSYMSTSVNIIESDYDTVEKACENLETKLNFEKIQTPDSLEGFASKRKAYLYRKVLEPISPDSTKVTLITVSEYKSVSENLNGTFKSFLHQEIDTTLVLRNPGDYYNLPPKSVSELNRRIWINSGCGIRYAASDNPFADKSDGCGALSMGALDMLSISMAILGPIFAEEPTDKIMFPVGGILISLVYKFVTKSETEKTVHEYNNIIESGYLLPGELRDK